MMGKGLGTSSALFWKPPERASGSYSLHLWYFCQHFKTADVVLKANSTLYFTYIIAFVDEDNVFNSQTLEII